MDIEEIVRGGEFNVKKFDFVETSLITEPHENYDDIVEQKIFKYKYRQCNDNEETYKRRQDRMLQRFNERARNRDPALEVDLIELYQKDDKDLSVAQFMLDPKNYKATAHDDTRVFREYMAEEAQLQYRDYYESDGEEQVFFEFLDNITNRDKIRFMEIFKDYTVLEVDRKDYAMIEKREYNPELSIFANLVLDLQDFKDRVRPLARDITLMDAARKYQKIPQKELDTNRERLKSIMDNFAKHGAPLQDYESDVKEISSADDSSLEGRNNNKTK